MPDKQHDTPEAHGELAEPKGPTLPIPVHHVQRIRELLDVIPATERARVDQIRALLPDLV